MKLAKNGYCFSPTRLALLWLLAMLAAMLSPTAVWAQDQPQSGQVQLEINTNPSLPVAPPLPTQANDINPPAQPLSAEQIPQVPMSGEVLPSVPAVPAVPGANVVPPPPPQPGFDSGAIPNVPVDAPPPVPPATSPEKAQLPEEEPKTPEEVAALDAKREAFLKLDAWHQQIMSGYVFSATLMNDPFMPIESVARPPEEDAQKQNENRKKLPLLRRLALNQFTLNAIIVAANPKDSTALVDSGGRGFILHKGTLIGPNNGYVKDITATRVVVEENEVNSRGESRPKEIVFSLNTLEEEVDDMGAIFDGDTLLFQQPDELVEDPGGGDSFTPTQDLSAQGNDGFQTPSPDGVPLAE
ncbi:MAG: hypothetical protein LBT62_05840 [Deltaproteobacteria bacterium]|jgi:Tfp pilus assembly protein PilP|nr:hypothetical protein [Deltaproteobacteria bacterium]